MAHKTGQKSSSNGRDSQSKRLGIKLYAARRSSPAASSSASVAPSTTRQRRGRRPRLDALRTARRHRRVRQGPPQGERGLSDSALRYFRRTRKVRLSFLEAGPSVPQTATRGADGPASIVGACLQAMGNSPIVFPHVRRLKDLQRQRALAQEQLAWLDREIAKETGQTPPVPTPAPVRPAAANEIEAARAAEEIIAQYRKPGMNTEKDVKRAAISTSSWPWGCSCSPPWSPTSSTLIRAGSAQRFTRWPNWLHDSHTASVKPMYFTPVSKLVSFTGFP